MTQIQVCRGVKLKGQNNKLKKKKKDTLLNSPAEQSKVILYKTDTNMNIGSWTDMNMSMKFTFFKKSPADDP